MEISIFIIGTISFGVACYLLYTKPDPSDQQYFILSAMLALGSGFVSSVAVPRAGDQFTSLTIEKLGDASISGGFGITLIVFVASSYFREKKERSPISFTISFPDFNPGCSTTGCFVYIVLLAPVILVPLTLIGPLGATGGQFRLLDPTSLVIELLGLAAIALIPLCILIFDLIVLATCAFLPFLYRARIVAVVCWIGFNWSLYNLFSDVGFFDLPSWRFRDR